MAARRVLLLTNELATASAVAAGLGTGGKLAPEDVCRDFSALSDRLQQSGAPAALVDIDSPGTLATLDSLVRRFTDTRFVVLANAMDNQRLLEAMQIGARHYLLKDAIASELSGVLHRICPNGTSERHGAVFTILSAGGGCGATTLAVNLANELQLSMAADRAARTLIVDLDTSYGSVGPYLGVDGEYGILDLLDRSGPLDGNLIETSSLAYGDGLHALVSASQARLGEPASLDPARLAAAVGACAGAYAAVVVDAPRVGLAAATELVRASDATLLLFQLTVKDIRTARRMLSALAPGGATGTPGGRTGGITPVVTRYNKRAAMITLAEAREALGHSELATLPDDYSAAGKSLNLGKLLADVAPRSDLRREIQQLAARLAALHLKQTAPVNGAKR